MTIALERTTTSVSSRPSTHRLMAPIALVIDLMMIGLALAVAAAARSFIDSVLPLPVVDATSAISVAAPYIALAWVLCLAIFGAYSAQFFGAGVDEYKVVVQGSVLTAGLVGVGCYLTTLQLPRGFFLILFLVAPLLLVSGRLVLRRAVYRLRVRGIMTRRTLIAGTPSHVEEIVAVLNRESWLGYQVVGSLTPDRLELGEGTVPTLGRVAEIRDVTDAHRVDVVFLAGGASESAAEVRQLLWKLERSGVEVIVAPSITDISRERVRVRPVAGLPLVHLAEPRTVAAGRISKRLFDMVGAGLGLLVISPLLLTVALWIKLNDGGPVFYKQARVGRDGRMFNCLKFRSMVVDADRMLDELRDRNEFDDVLFKLKDDPRVTRPGRLLRRLSLDELPQLWNVIRGDMSLVGPRPPLEQETLRYTPEMMRRLRVRPGITGLWQISGRSDLTWSDTVRLDLYYVDNWSMIQDLVILFRTLSVVISGRGAY